MAGPERIPGAPVSGTPRTTSTEAGRWLLKYGDQIYGPYTHAAMKGYIAEGRVIAESLIAPEGTHRDAADWQVAGATADFVELFKKPDAAQASALATETAQIEAEHVDERTGPMPGEPDRGKTQSAASRQIYGPDKGQTDRRRRAETANFVLIMDIKARFVGPLEQAIMSLGPAYKVAPNVWCVNTNATAAGLLNDLSIHIGKTDSMFIIDATRDRTAWCNLGPETDAKIRRVWRRPF
jgi:hypothetical protein